MTPRGAAVLAVVAATLLLAVPSMPTTRASIAPAGPRATPSVLEGHLGPGGSVSGPSTGPLPAPRMPQIPTLPSLSSPVSAWSSLKVTYDPADGYLVGFASWAWRPTASETWTYRHGQWTNVTSSPSPFGPEYQMAYDPADRAVVLLENLIHPYLQAESELTWLFRQGHWYNVTANQTSTPYERGASMATDSRLGGVLLTTPGNSSSYANPQPLQTWEFQNGPWSQLSPPQSPPTRSIPSLCDDPADGGVLLYSSSWQVVSNTTLPLGPNLTWLFVNGTWVNRTVTPSPGSWWGFECASMGRSVVLWGGDHIVVTANQTYQVNDTSTWAYSNGTWTALPTNGSYPSSCPTWNLSDCSVGLPYTGAYDAADGYLFYGWNLSPAWGFHNGTWSPVPLALALVGTTSLYAGGAVQLTIQPVGGFGPYRCSWVASGAVRGSGASCSAVVAAPTPGNATFFAWVNDSANESAVVEANLLVFAPLGIAALRVPSRGDVGERLTFSANLTGGAPPVRLSWAFGDGATSLLPTAAHAYLRAGSYPVEFSATDALGSTRSAFANVTVAAALAATLQPTLPRADANVFVPFLANLSGGSAPYAVTVAFGDGSSWNFSEAAAVGAELAHPYDRPGTFNVTESVTDAAGGTNRSLATVEVAPALALALAPPNGSVAPGELARVAFTLRGGTAPYAYSWSWGDGARTTGRNDSHVYGEAGTFAVRLTVSDGGGGNVSAFANVTVVAPAGPPAATPLPTLGIAVGLGAAGVAAAAALAARRGRRARGGEARPGEEVLEDP